MSMIDRRKKLVIFGGSRRLSESCLYENNLYNQYNSSSIYHIRNSYSLEGFLNIDILFACGWWQKSDSDIILSIIEQYIKMGEGRVIGDNRYIPPYFLERYKLIGNREEIDEPVISRFDILDIR